jgi:peptidoglycan hydrolase-like protein with peptidoglycan-binding domain
MCALITVKKIKRQVVRAHRCFGPQAVKNIQRELKRSGFDPGQIDGIWGDNIQQALKDFQEAHSLKPTGNLNITTACILTGGMGTDQTPATDQD